MRWLVLLALVSVLMGCGGEGDVDSQDKAVKVEGTKEAPAPSAKMPAITASFDTRTEFATYLVDLARNGKLEALLAATPPKEYLLDWHESIGRTYPDSIKKVQMLYRAKKHYRDQIAAFVALFDQFPDAEIEYFDIGNESFSDPETVDRMRQESLGLSSDYGDVAVVIGDLETLLRMFRHKGHWCIASFSAGE